MLATTSIGAIWSGCGPDFGARGVLDRFSQLTPRLMFCVDGYRYGGKAFERRAEMQGIAEGLPTLEHVVLVPYLQTDDRRPLRPGSLFWDDLMYPAPLAVANLNERVAADHRSGSSIVWNDRAADRSCTGMPASRSSR
jgi:acetoacetyl-CoA synthetase